MRWKEVPRIFHVINNWPLRIKPNNLQAISSFDVSMQFYKKSKIFFWCFVIWKFRSGYLESNFSDVSWHMSLTKSCKPSGINNLLRSSDKLASYNLPKVLRHSKNEILKISRNYQTKNYNKYLFQPLGDPTVLKFQSRDLDGYLTVST